MDIKNTEKTNELCDDAYWKNLAFEFEQKVADYIGQLIIDGYPEHLIDEDKTK